MKNMLIPCVCLFAILQIGKAIAQTDPYPRRLSTNNNFIQTITPTIPVMDTAGLVLATSSETIDYFDGLGRYERTVVRGGGSDYSDLIFLQEYDPYGRTAEKWLTSIGEKGAGSCIHFSSVKSNAVNSRLYNDPYPCVNTKFEASPLNRPLERYGAGSVWRTAKKYEKFQYLSNDDSPELKCVRYQVAGERENPALRIVGQYAPGSLIVTRSTTEDGAVALKFENTAGQTILSRVQCGSQYLDTYAVYDNFGNLCFVLSPNTSAALDTTIDEEELNRTGYQYRYDEKNRCIAKKLPGTDWVYFQYDADDKLIYSQDGNLRKRNINLWAFVLYDVLGREVMTGYARINIDGIQLGNKHYVALRSNLDGLYGYSLPADLPADSLEVTRVFYYDDYPCYDDPHSDKLAYVDDSDYGSRDVGILRGKGLMTATLRFIPESTVPLYSAFYYDSRGRLVQSRSTNHTGGVSNVYNKYDFVGKLLRSKEEHSTSADNSKFDWLEQRVYYNHAGLPDSTCYLLNGLYSTTVCKTYDCINRLVSTGYGVNGNSIIDSLRYNIRSWITEKSITTADGERKFAMSLYYQNPRYSSTTPSYTGNITEWSWRHGDDETSQTYAFTYDNLSRLSNTKQYIDNIADDQFVERGMSYDRNGNLLSLQRTAQGATSDDLTYSYTGNQLTTIGGTTLGSYSYDANGNITHDGPNNLDLSYNSQNLIEKVTRAGTILAKYVYLSDGTKLSALDVAGNGLVYLGSLVYRKQDERLAFESTAFDGGRFVATATGVEPFFHLTDHLGSVRAIVDANGNLLERNDYYPYGMRWENPGSMISDNRHRYNGKEEQGFVNLPYSDYGARMRDARYKISWHGLDVLAEQRICSSQYVFCSNNPILRIDLNGMLDDEYYNEKGQKIYDTGTGNKTYIIKTSNKNIATGAPIKPEVAQYTEQKIAEGQLTGDHEQNVVEIVPIATLKIAKAVIKDDGTGGHANKPDNQRETGGNILDDNSIADVTQGPMRGSFGHQHASVLIPENTAAKATFHSHPSATFMVNGKPYGSVMQPSQADYDATKNRINYIFQMNYKTILIHDKTNVLATLPFSVLK